MIDIHYAMLAVGSLRRMSVVAAALLIVAVACSSGDDAGAATAAPAEPVATDASTATEAPIATVAPVADAGDPTPTDAAATAAALDFGSGTGSITLGEETFEFVIGPGTGTCRDVFEIIAASGKVAGDRDIEGQFSIPPLDWETYTDGRFAPPSVDLEITSTGEDNARWRADAAWALESDKVGMSQVDSYEKDGRTASGSATFANAWDSDTESVQGTFEISCAEG